MANKKVAGVQLNLKNMPPLEDLTAQTQYKDKPYMHLMRGVVVPGVRRRIRDFMNETIKFKDGSPSLKSHVNNLV